jgi:hypothetical protein
MLLKDIKPHAMNKYYLPGTSASSTTFTVPGIRSAFFPEKYGPRRQLRISLFFFGTIIIRLISLRIILQEVSKIINQKYFSKNLRKQILAYIFASI